MMKSEYCTNHYCSIRKHCKKGLYPPNLLAWINYQWQSFLHGECFGWSNFECLHKTWRNYPSKGIKECDHCHEQQPIHNDILHQR